MICNVSFDVLGIQLEQDAIETSILGNCIPPEHNLVLDIIQTYIFGIATSKYEFSVWRDVNRVKMLILG